MNRKRILVLWGSSNLHEVCVRGFVENPDLEVELISAEPGPGRRATYPTLFKLRRRVVAGEFDLIVSGNINRSPFPGNKAWPTAMSLALRYLTYQHTRLDAWWAPHFICASGGRVPLAVVDARDFHYILPWDWPLLQSSTLYFKRDLMAFHRRTLLPLQDYLTEKIVQPHLKKIRPYSTGLEESRIPAQVRPTQERDIDLLLSGSINNPLRRDILARTEKLSSRYKVFINNGLLPFSEYLEMLQRAKMVICVEAYGGETWRQYEVSAAGAVPLLSWPYITPLEPLEPDLHAIYFSHFGDHFERQVSFALSDLGRLQEIATLGRAFTIRTKGRRRLASLVVEQTLAAHQASW